jgi:hypothetical protein
MTLAVFLDEGASRVPRDRAVRGFRPRNRLRRSSGPLRQLAEGPYHPWRLRPPGAQRIRAAGHFQP